MSLEKTACILCSRNCGLEVETEDGQFTRIRGDEDHPVSKGYVCQKGARAWVTSARGEIEVVVQPDATVRRGMVTLPHGHGTRYSGSEPIGPALNQLTSAEHCEAFTRTPFHKHVPVRIRASESAN